MADTLCLSIRQIWALHSIGPVEIDQFETEHNPFWGAHLQYPANSRQQVSSESLNKLQFAHYLGATGDQDIPFPDTPASPDLIPTPTNHHQQETEHSIPTLDGGSADFPNVKSLELAGLTNEQPPSLQNLQAPVLHKPFHKRSTGRASRRQKDAEEGQGSSEYPKSSYRSHVGNRRKSTYQIENPRERACRSHALVERRYREGLRAKLDQLEEAMRSVRRLLPVENRCNYQDSTAHSNEPKNTKRTKMDTLHDALSYIYQSEVDLRHLSEENVQLQVRVRQLEKLVQRDEHPGLRQIDAMQVSPI